MVGDQHTGSQVREHGLRVGRGAGGGTGDWVGHDHGRRTGGRGRGGGGVATALRTRRPEWAGFFESECVQNFPRCGFTVSLFCTHNTD